PVRGRRRSCCRRFSRPPAAKMPSAAVQCKRMMTCEELCLPPVITFLPNGGRPEESQIFEEGVERRHARDEEAQGRYAEEWPLGPQGQEPQTGDGDRTVGGEGQGQEGAEEGLQETQ